MRILAAVACALALAAGPLVAAEGAAAASDPIGSYAYADGTARTDSTGMARASRLKE